SPLASPAGRVRETFEEASKGVTWPVASSTRSTPPLRSKLLELTCCQATRMEPSGASDQPLEPMKEFCRAVRSKSSVTFPGALMRQSCRDGPRMTSPLASPAAAVGWRVVELKRAVACPVASLTRLRTLVETLF